MTGRDRPRSKAYHLDSPLNLTGDGKVTAKWVPLCVWCFIILVCHEFFFVMYLAGKVGAFVRLVRSLALPLTIHCSHPKSPPGTPNGLRPLLGFRGNPQTEGRERIIFTKEKEYFVQKCGNRAYTHTHTHTHTHTCVFMHVCVCVCVRACVCVRT